MTERHSMTRLGTVRGAGRAAPEDAGRLAPGWPGVILRVAGSGLLIATAAIHLDLYLTGYRTIPAIGWLFLLQVIAAFGLGLAVLAIPSRLVIPGRLAAAAGPASPWLPSAATSCRSGSGCSGSPRSARPPASSPASWRWPPSWSWPRSRLLPRRRTPRGGAAAAPATFPAQISPAIARAAGMTTAALAAVALLLLGFAVAGASSAAPAAPATALKTTTIDGTTVLTNAQGFTLYSFAPDTPASSKCYGSCAVYWPPVTGTAAAGQGLPGKVTTITRTGGSRQLTYNGHPLYTYIGDAAPGQARGNNLNLNGGLWHEVPASR